MGRDYDDTRHNIGFDVVDFLAKEQDATWRNDHHGDLAEFKSRGRKFILLKPSTYMNLSGKAIRYWMQKEKIQQENLLVILDDLNLDFGKIRMKTKGSAGGHNGLKSIQELLNTSQYTRLRIGIGSQFGRGKQVNFVLGKWSNDEAAELPNIIEKAAKATLAFGTIGVQRAMSQFNG